MLENIRTVFLSWSGFRMNVMNTGYLVAFKVYDLTHCGRVTQICIFNTVKLSTSASSP
jgi:hypothetical protein